MQPVSHLTLLVLVLVGGRAVIDSAKPDTCTSEYEGHTKNIHTMCLTDHPDAVQVTLTQADKDAAVTRHNDIRANVTPTAANMQKMVWDDDLAKVAAKWAMQCVVDHDKNRSVPELKAYGSWVGQNAGGGYRSVVHAINGWFSEVKDWIFGTWTKSTGHYIQDIWHSSSRVGCGVARCDNSKYRTYLMCNYFPGVGGGDPYEQGAPCSKCPDHCDASGKLCDCGGLACANGGKLNVSTCGCECKPLWKGRDCTTERCPGVVCQNHGTVNPGTCKCDCTPGFTGDLCETCPRKDAVHWCDYQTFHPEVKCPNGTDNWYSRQCPIRCGVCPEPCPDTVCQHHGTVNPDKCTCVCQPGITGQQCETCPTKDNAEWCTYYSFKPDESCPNRTNNWYSKQCPVRCGMC
ncbi:cysteine-rich venom protein Mr30-like isoform X3 [Littorina saxatilis]|uniref:cysteine-rich venom protein Mr30-like isoform X3 n=1 Tax=Littorina saxatilis TaxID=31220 RepID=UPI0038B4E911